MSRFLFITIIFFLFFTEKIHTQTNLQKAITQLADDADLKHAGFGFCLIDIEQNKIIAQHNADLALIPASSLKVVTTATALGVLGADYQFKTTLEYDGDILPDGTLRGNIYIKGYGDPTLASHEMEGITSFDKLMQNFADAVKRAGIKSIEGYVVGDASFFETAATGRTWIWEDMGNYYAGGAHGLNIHENLYYLDFRQFPKLNQAPRATATRPQVPDIQFINELQSAGANSGDNAYIFGAPYTRTRYVRGTLPIGTGTFTIKGSLPEPAYFAAYHLAKTLEKNGIHTGMCVSTQRIFKENKNKKRRVIFTSKSPSLRDIVERANIKSVNLYCESLVKTMGAEKQGKGTAEAGLEVIKNYWTERGVDMSGFVMRDGSGLSPRNAVSTKHLTQIMRKAAKNPAIYKDFNASLSVAGSSGSLKNMFAGTRAAGNLRAKSGYMDSVRSYTGYAKNKSGKLMAFSIIVNNYSGGAGAMRKKMEKVMTALVE